MIKEMLIDHPYYSSDSNWYSNEAGETWESMTDFLDEYEDADVDMNLVFRWDIHENTDDESDKPLGTYSAEIFIIHQRKGIYSPQRIESVKEDEIPRLKEYLAKHWAQMRKMWEPISLKENNNDHT